MTGMPLKRKCHASESKQFARGVLYKQKEVNKKTSVSRFNAKNKTYKLSFKIETYTFFVSCRYKSYWNILDFTVMNLPLCIT